MRVRLGTALLVIVCLVALALPQASAGRRRYKRKCDLVGCQKCYTSPNRACYGRTCHERYACEEDKCAENFIFNEASGMCDCKEGTGIVLGRCSYKRYFRTSGFSAYYFGVQGYNKLPDRAYSPRSRGYGPGSFGYRQGLYVSGPFCQPCPQGYTSPGGEPMTTFCVPESSLGTLQLPTQPTTTGTPFDVEVTFNVPGGCGSLGRQDVLVQSNPAGITCRAARVDAECKATTACTASKTGTFRVYAKLKGVAGIVTDTVDVVVPDAATTQLTLKVNYNDLSQQQREDLATSAADDLNAQLGDSGGRVEVESIREGSIVITFVVASADPSQLEAVLAIVQSAWPAVTQGVVNVLAGSGVRNSNGQPFSLADITTVILVNGAPVVLPELPSPPPGAVPSPPPPPSATQDVFVRANATIRTTGLDQASITKYQGDIKRVANEIVAGQFTGITVDSVVITPGQFTQVFVWLSSPVLIVDTVVATLQQDGTQNVIRTAVWAAIHAGQFDIALVVDKGKIRNP